MTFDKDTIKKLDLKHPSTWLATWFGLGFIPKAPGTWGSLGALPFGMIIYAFGGNMALLVGVLLITAIGFWASKKFEAATGIHDSKMIVIDEVAGMWIALIPAGLDPWLVLLAFALFRVFDITKPWPASYFDKKIKGPLGVMGDDIIAGIFAALCITGIQYAGFG